MSFSQKNFRLLLISFWIFLVLLRLIELLQQLLLPQLILSHLLSDLLLPLNLCLLRLRDHNSCVSVASEHTFVEHEILRRSLGLWVSGHRAPKHQSKQRPKNSRARDLCFSSCPKRVWLILHFLLSNKTYWMFRRVRHRFPFVFKSRFKFKKSR